MRMLQYSVLIGSHREHAVVNIETGDGSSSGDRDMWMNLCIYVLIINENQLYE